MALSFPTYAATIDGNNNNGTLVLSPSNDDGEAYDAAYGWFDASGSQAGSVTVNAGICLGCNASSNSSKRYEFGAFAQAAHNTDSSRTGGVVTINGATFFENSTIDTDEYSYIGTSGNLLIDNTNRSSNLTAIGGKSIITTGTTKFTSSEDVSMWNSGYSGNSILLNNGSAHAEDGHAFVEGGSHQISVVGNAVRSEGVANISAINGQATVTNTTGRLHDPGRPRLRVRHLANIIP